MFWEYFKNKPRLRFYKRRSIYMLLSESDKIFLSLNGKNLKLMLSWIKNSAVAGDPCQLRVLFRDWKSILTQWLLWSLCCGLCLLKRDKTARSLFIWQDSDIHQDLCIYIKIRVYTSRFIYIHQDSWWIHIVLFRDPW